LSYTGWQTRSGEPIRIEFRGLPGEAAVNTAFVTLAYDVSVSMHRGGCDVSMYMLAGRSTWRGTLEIEADRLSLRNDQGDPEDVRDLFLGVDSIASVEAVQTEVGGGLPPQISLAWPQDPTDDQVPGLKSLLEYLAEERPPKNFYVTRGREGRGHVVVEPLLQICKNTRLAHANSSHFAITPEQPLLLVSRKGPAGNRGAPGRAPTSEEILTQRTHVRTREIERRQPQILGVFEQVWQTAKRIALSKYRAKITRHARGTRLFSHANPSISRSRNTHRCW